MPQKNHGIDSLAITGGNINIAYETFGKTGDPPLLLIMGLGYQMMY
ncbi:MAG: hypothetical protein JRI75_08050, partial [Deltaproteobacteria bacterium]|nr:hypothetical protein [Deltaproteobacteria bacterium]